MRRSTRYTLLRSSVVLAFALLVGRLWWMQIVQVNAYKAQAAASEQTRVILAPRGIIYDRNGIPLVRNFPSLDVTVTPDEWPTWSTKRESALLSSLLHSRPTPQQIEKMVRHARSVNPTRAIPIKLNLGLKTFYVVRSFADQLPGVSATVDQRRREYLGKAPYPLAHILGYTLPISAAQYKVDGPSGSYRRQRYTLQDAVGQDGVEALFEHELHGTNGVQASVIDAHGNQVGPWKTIHPAVPGNGIRLTIDSRLEQSAARDLKQAMNKLDVPQGAAVAMNPRNGQVLADVSLPSYNNNAFTRPSGPKRNRAIAAIVRNASHPLYDLSTRGQAPPGSIFKVVTATAGLEDHVITPQTEVDDTGKLQFCPTCPVFNGWNPNGLGWVEVVSAIEESSDLFFYQVAGGGPDIANGLGPKRLGAWARRYGLGRPTGVGLPNESPGFIPTTKYLWKTEHRKWSYGDSYNMGIGQGADLVTPIQMATVVSTIANGGSLVKPTLVQAITTPDGSKALPGKNFGLVPNIVHRHMVASWVVNLISQGMRLGVTSTLGTSHFNVDLRNQAAGKTGTAEVPDGVDAWWIGFAPYNHPRIAVCVLVPNAGAEGAFAAAPVGSKIIDDYMHIKDRNWLNQVVKRLDFVN